MAPGTQGGWEGDEQGVRVVCPPSLPASGPAIGGPPRGLGPVCSFGNFTHMNEVAFPHGLYRAWDSPGQNTGVRNRSLLQGIFPTQGENPGLSHCGWILYQLSHQGSPRILEWVAYPFSSRSSQPRNQTGVSCVAGRATWEAPNKGQHLTI